MRDFFHGWRRKMGVVTLGMSMLLWGSWIRSRFAVDVVGFRVGDRAHTIVAFDGDIIWSGTTTSDHAWRIDSMDRSVFVFSRAVETQLLKGDPALTKSLQLNVWTFPELILVAPLTLLSAYLILWTPRKRKAESDA